MRQRKIHYQGEKILLRKENIIKKSKYFKGAKTLLWRENIKGRKYY